MLICPIISRGDEKVILAQEENVLRIQKGEREVRLYAQGEMRLPYGTERIFNLVPGLQAVRVDLGGGEGVVEFEISI